MLNNMKLLVGFLIIIAGLAYWVLQDSQKINEPKALIQDWQQDENHMAQINKVILSQAEEQIVLQQTGKYWVLNGGFYASIDPLFNLLQSFKNAEIVESKTANPENHAQVELSAENLKVEFYDSNNLLHAIQVGKKSTADLTFVRRADENQTYVVKGLDAITFNQDSWQLKTVLDIAGDEVQSVSINPASGEAIEVSRNPADGQWAINNIPVDHQLQPDATLEQLSSGLSRLMIDEALPVDVSNMTEQLTVMYELIQGQKIAVKVYQLDDTYYMLIESDQFPEYAAWMMKIAEYKFKALNRQLSEFIEPVEPQADVTGSTTSVDETVPVVE